MSEGLQDLETTAAGKHDVQNDEVKHLRVGLKESIFAGLGHNDVVVLGLQGSGEYVGQLAFIFDDEDSHRPQIIASNSGGQPDIFLTFLSDNSDSEEVEPRPKPAAQPSTARSGADREQPRDASSCEQTQTDSLPGHLHGPVGQNHPVAVGYGRDLAGETGQQGSLPIVRSEPGVIHPRVLGVAVSAAAEQESRLLKKLEFFQRQLDARQPAEMRAVVTDARAHGLIVELPDADTIGLVPITTLPGGPFDFDSARSQFVNRRTRRAFKVGDELKVHVSRVDAARRTIDFAPI